MSTPAATHLLWTALERNADWIAAYISISRSAVVEDYLKWFFERLKDRVPQDASDQDLDHLVRAEVKSVYGEFRDRPSGLPLGDYADTSAHKALGDQVRAEQARECLEQLPKQIRNLLEMASSSEAASRAVSVSCVLNSTLPVWM